ncbi:MAG TPA: hypothetical protein VHU84_02290 [Lacipirellulaceae bacterium]|nr:hypothetical protein [Lacipirellulaceae bacterium]
MGRAKYVTCLALFGLTMLALNGAAPADSPFGAVPAGAEKLLPKDGMMGPLAKADTKGHNECLSASDEQRAAIEKIERVLRAPLASNGLDFAETPLKDVMTQLQDEYKIPIQIDVPALDEVGINSDAPVSTNIHNTSLQAALRLMLKNLQLTSIYQDEVLLITTNAAAEAQPVVSVYNVHDIVGGDVKELHALVETIMNCVAEDTWAENGGTHADIRTVKPDLLVISQSQSVHSKVRELLATIRKMREQAGVSPEKTSHAAAKPVEEVVTQSYMLQFDPTVDGESLRSQVRELITGSLPDEKWAGKLADGQAVTLNVFSDRVVVRHTPSVQEKVQKILDDSGVASLPSTATAPGLSRVSHPGGSNGGGSGGFGGGGGGVFSN